MNYKESIIYQTPVEQDVFRAELKKIKELDGDIAEVGVFQGGTAQIIKEEFPTKNIFLFDTFTGLSDMHPIEEKHFKKGECATTEEVVTKIFKGDDKVTIVKGEFPGTSDIIKDKKFCFVHLDTDIYYPTKDGLEFFYPRMVKGGVIIVHDYPVHPGVKLAVDEWKVGKEDLMVEGSWRQFIITKK